MVQRFVYTHAWIWQRCVALSYPGPCVQVSQQAACLIHGSNANIVPSLKKWWSHTPCLLSIAKRDGGPSRLFFFDSSSGDGQRSIKESRDAAFILTSWQVVHLEAKDRPRRGRQVSSMSSLHSLSAHLLPLLALRHSLKRSKNGRVSFLKRKTVIQGVEKSKARK